LQVDLSALTGYQNCVTITPWSSGITSQIEIEGVLENTNYLDSLPIAFEYISQQKDFEAWTQDIPADIRQLIIQHRDISYTALHLCSNHQEAYELFTSQPILFWLMVREARRQQWEQAYFVALLSMKRKHIAAVVGFPPTKSFQKLISKLDVDKFSASEFGRLRQLVDQDDWLALNHLSRIDWRLLHFAATQPIAIGTTLINWLSVISEHSKDAGFYYIASALLLEVSTITALRPPVTVDRATKIRTPNSLAKAELEAGDIYQTYPHGYTDLIGPFPPPPLVGTEDIQPITNYAVLRPKSLHFDRRRQILEGRYYTYITNYNDENVAIGLMLNGDTVQVREVRSSFYEQPSEEAFLHFKSWLFSHA